MGSQGGQCVAVGSVEINTKEFELVLGVSVFCFVKRVG